MGNKIENKPSLGTYFLAAQLIDLIWPIFVLLGIEEVRLDPGNTAFTPLNFVYYPFTHGLLSVIIWALLFGGIYYAIRKNFKASVILAVIVISHWLLDFLTHRPDLPLLPGSEVKVGLDLWDSVLLTILIESAIFIFGIYTYLNFTKAKNKTGVYSLWALIIFLAIVYLLNAFGPPPPSENAIGFAGLSMWVLVAWGYWIHKNRIIKV